MAWTLRRTAPSRRYWQEVQQLDGALLDGARDLGMSQHRTFPLFFAEVSTEEARRWWGVPRAVWKYGSMQIRLLGGITLKTADSSLTLPESLVQASYEPEGLSVPNASRVLSYKYLPPFGDIKPELHVQYAGHPTPTLAKDYDLLLQQMYVLRDS